MIVETCFIEGVKILKPKVFKDSRGYFLESFNDKTFKELVENTTNFVQDNESLSGFGTLRGIHYQKPPYTQAKLVRAVTGKILDVVVDLRKDSNTYGKWYSEILSAENKTQLFVPRGFGHGFVVLSEFAIFSYKVDNYYDKESDGGILWDDPSLAIEWQINSHQIILSEKDKTLQSFEDFSNNPVFKIN